MTIATVRNITLYKNIGLDNSYKHVILFDENHTLEQYLDTIKEIPENYLEIENANFIPNKLTLKVESKYFSDYGDGLWFTFSYCTFKMSTSTIEKLMCYFIISVNIISPTVVEIVLEEDVWNTYQQEFTIGECVIEREHVDRWNKDSTLPIYSKIIVEDKDISIYKDPVVTPICYNPYDTDALDSPSFPGFCFITYMDGSVLTSMMIPYKPVGSSVEGTDYPYRFYNREMSIYGFALTSKHISNGEYIKVFDINPENIVSVSITKTAPFSWIHTIVTEDNIEYWSFVLSDYVLFDIDTVTHTDHDTEDYNAIYIKFTFKTRGIEEPIYHQYIKPGTNVPISISTNLEKPSSLTQPVSSIHEPAMAMYPYVDRYFMDSAGTRIHNVSNNMIFTHVTGLYTKMLLQSSGYSAIVYMSYPHGDSEFTYETIVKANSLGLSCLMSAPVLDVPSNRWLTYVHTSRDTDRQMIVSQSTQGVLQGIANGVSVGLLAENPLGLLGPIASGLIDIPFNFVNQDIKEQSVRNMSQTLLFDGTGDASLMSGDIAFKYVTAECNDTVKNIASERYHKYGYNTNRIGIPNINNRAYFNFLKTELAQIEGSIPTNIRLRIERILRNGVTIWHADNLILNTMNIIAKNYDYENIERGLL